MVDQTIFIYNIDQIKLVLPDSFEIFNDAFKTILWLEAAPNVAFIVLSLDWLPLHDLVKFREQ